MLNSSYSGLFDVYDIRIGDGVQKFHTSQGTETYSGPFIRDTYNGYGQYIANNELGESWSYEGMFYCNNFHGYGTLSYADGSIFSGLFKHGKQFGPGVFTYPNGKQDVGIWFGSQLLRLTVPIELVDNLCNNPKDRIQCSVFKKLVPLPNEEENTISKEILIEARAEATRAMEHGRKLYSRHCKNPKSYLFDHQLYKDYKNRRITDLRDVVDDLFLYGTHERTDPTTYVNLEHIRLNKTEYDNVTEEEKQDMHWQVKSNLSEVEEKMNEKYLLSWNNQDIIIELMLHSFQYRRQECVSDYDIGDILCNRRKCFSECGEKENACIQMLEASAANDARTILKLIKDHRLNPNVMDNKGNSMILMAAANDCELVIRILRELGVDMDAVNDEGFNALNHTLTRYIAVKDDVTDWASAFLNPSNQLLGEQHPIKEWLAPDSSLTLLSKKLSSKVKSSCIRRKSSFLRKHKINIKSRNVFDLTPSPPEQEKMYSDDLTLSKMDEESSQISTCAVQLTKIKRLKKIERTFHALIKAGADIHCSKTPHPLLTLAIFTRSVPIVEDILKRGVDPNSVIKLPEGQLFPLHIMALIRPSAGVIEIANLLLKYGANPLMKTEKNYRRQWWGFLLGFGRKEKLKTTSGTPEGLTPLHALILRPDAEYVRNKEILLELCCILSSCTGQELFHGLSPLGLAVAINSLPFATVVFKCSDVDINFKYDDFWGNPLTTFMIAQGSSSDHDSPMLKFLIKNGANPLAREGFPENENVMNFLENYKLNNSGNLYSHEKGKRSSFKSTLTQVSKFQEFEKKEQFIRKIGRGIVENHLKGVLVRSLLYCMQSSAEDEPELAELFPLIIKGIKDWMQPKEFTQVLIANLKSPEYASGSGLISAVLAFINFTDLFHKEKMKPNDLLQFIKKIRTSEENVSKKSSLVEESFTNFVRKETVEIKSKNEKLHKCQIKAPETDKDGDLYMVCYQCLKRSKDLFLCQLCQLVHFCSYQCAVSPPEAKSKHKCKLESLMLKQMPGENQSDFSTETIHDDDKEQYSKNQRKKEYSPRPSSRFSTEIRSKSGDESEEENDKPAVLKWKKRKWEKKNKQRSPLSIKGVKAEKGIQSRSREKEEEKKSTQKIRSHLSKTRIIKRTQLQIRTKKVLKISRKHEATMRHSKLLRNKIRKSKTLKEMELMYKRKKGEGSLMPKKFPFFSKLLKSVQTYGWRKSFFTLIHGTKWHISSDSASSSSSISYLARDFIKGTVCPTVNYNILGGRVTPYEICKEHESVYKFSLEERLQAFLLDLDLDYEKLFPYLVYIPNIGTVCYKSYPVHFENFSFN